MYMNALTIKQLHLFATIVLLSAHMVTDRWPVTLSVLLEQYSITWQVAVPIAIGISYVCLLDSRCTGVCLTECSPNVKGL
jgi:hypothetical protein